MGDSNSTTFLSTRAALSSNPSYNLGTPSQLTPNTRSEAEAALTSNSEAQTDSAAPTTPLPDAAARFEAMAAGMDRAEAKNIGVKENTVDEAKLAYKNPLMRSTSSSNYAEALVGAGISPTSQTSPISDLSKMSPESIAAMKGVVPLKTGVGEGQAEAVKRARPVGLSLGDLGRKQSWSPEDFKHVYSERLMVKGEGDPGYSSTVEEG